MNLSILVKNAAEKLKISKLNSMQLQMAETPARDIILEAPTGSGKTLAFAARMLRDIDPEKQLLQAIVLAPSRELVTQSTGVIKALAPTVRTVAFYGGHSMEDERNSLQVTPQVIVATPGRLIDHINRGQVEIATTSVIVLDEYDKMLDAGFQDEMKRILKRVGEVTLRILTSATHLQALPDFVGDMSRMTVFDFAGEMTQPRKNMEIVEVPSAVPDKLTTLTDLLRSLDNQKVIIFANHRESAERIYEALRRQGFPAGLYHGGLEQDKRQLAVDLLENATTPILVATDIAARGLDISDLGSVIHYHLPVNQETWIHRNGRTARMGASGTVYVIVNEKDNNPGITYARRFVPKSASKNPITSTTATLYISGGRKEKISRGDIAGFLMQKGGLKPDEVGLIKLADHHAIVAVPQAKAEEVLEAVKPHKLKNKRLRISKLA